MGTDRFVALRGGSHHGHNVVFVGEQTSTIARGGKVASFTHTRGASPRGVFRGRLSRFVSRLPFLEVCSNTQIRLAKGFEQGRGIEVVQGFTLFWRVVASRTGVKTTGGAHQ